LTTKIFAMPEPTSSGRKTHGNNLATNPPIRRHQGNVLSSYKHNFAATPHQPS
jgi:hypothetical protein